MLSCKAHGPRAHCICPCYVYVLWKGKQNREDSGYSQTTWYQGWFAQCQWRPWRRRRGEGREAEEVSGELEKLDPAGGEWALWHLKQCGGRCCYRATRGAALCARGRKGAAAGAYDGSDPVSSSLAVRQARKPSGGGS